MKTNYWIVGAIIALTIAVVLVIFFAATQSNTAIKHAEQFGFIRALEDGKVIRFDEAAWLTGTEAETAAIETGLCTETTREECLPNGFYIDNRATSTIPLRLAADAEIYLVTWKMEEMGQIAPQQISHEAFAALVNDSKLHWNQLPYEITIVDDNVIKIEEIYLP